MEHVLFLRWKEETSSQKKQEIADALMSLKNSIGSIKRISYGETFTNERAKNFTHALVVQLCSKEALKEYAKHPKHLEVVDIMKPQLDELICLDFITPTTEEFDEEAYDFLNEESEEDALRRSGSLPIPTDMQSELLERLQYLQRKNSDLEESLYTSRILSFLSGAAFGTLGALAITSFIRSR